MSTLKLLESGIDRDGLNYVIRGTKKSCILKIFRGEDENCVSFMLTGHYDYVKQFI